MNASANNSTEFAGDQGPLLIAICPDYAELEEGGFESFARAWARTAKAGGHRVRLVNLLKTDVIERLADCDGLMFRFAHTDRARAIARRILPAVELGLGIPVYPSWRTAWHFEDKLSQFYLLNAAGIRTPKTWIFWDKALALRFLDTATYPFVTKLSAGFRSANVRLVTTREQGRSYVERLFGTGLSSFDVESEADPMALTLTGTQAGYFYAQEFVPGNDYDTRITIIGNRCFASRRYNRPDDFRASGSGLIDRHPDAIDLDAVHLGFRIARRLGLQSVAMDVLRHGGELVVTEVSYAFEARKIRACPGHWVSEDESASLVWRDGQYGPEEAIFEDFAYAASAARAARSSHGERHGAQ